MTQSVRPSGPSTSSTARFGPGSPRVEEVRLPSRPYLAVKRALDVVVASLGLLLSLPLWGLIALAILLEDGRPVFFTQERFGYRGRVFRLVKFRSMRKGSNPIVDSDQRRDRRLTRVGRLLRATALDELPNLLNIIRGDISFVGPKPLYPRVMDPADPDHGRRIEEVPGAWRRSLVRPGLTGLAQVYAPKNAPYRHKFRYDALYIRKANLWLDLRLFVLSFLKTFSARWERVAHRRGG